MQNYSNPADRENENEYYNDGLEEGEDYPDPPFYPLDDEDDEDDITDEELDEFEEELLSEPDADEDFEE